MSHHGGPWVVSLMVGECRPWELDDAVRRRLVKRIYVPMPDVEARVALLRNTLRGQPASLRDVEYERIAQVTEGCVVIRVVL